MKPTGILHSYLRNLKNSKNALKPLSHGFTLMEIMIIIAIIGVLSAALYPALGLYHGRARDAVRVADISRIRSALQIYHSEKDSYPSFSGGDVPITTSPFVTDCLSANVWTGTLGRSLGNILNIDSFPTDPVGNDIFCYKYSTTPMYQAGGKTASYYCPTFSKDGGGYILKFATEIRTIPDNGFLLQNQSGSMSTYCVDDGTNSITASGFTVMTSGSGYTWTLTGITACSAPCGGGTETGTVVCTGPSGMIIDSSFCTGTPPSNTQTCNTFACTQVGNCGGSIPINAANNNGGSTNYIQTWNGTNYMPASLAWFFNSVSAECAFICDLNYTWNGSSCVPDTQATDCGGSIPPNATATTATGYTQAWNGSSWIPVTSWTNGGGTCGFACNTNYTWSGGTNSCILNTYTVSGSFGTNAAGATVSVCGSNVTADASGNFSRTGISHGTACNNISATRTNYTCSTGVNGPASLTSNISNVTGNCSANTQTYTCAAKPATGTIWNTVSFYIQTWDGSAWMPANSTTTYNTTANTTSCNYICASGYNWNGSSCVANAACGGTSNTCSSGISSLYNAGSCGGNQTWTCTSGTNSLGCSLANSPCPVNCSYNTYNGSCSVSCGGGNYYRYYNITIPASYGGTCAVSQGQYAGLGAVCNTNPCAVNGVCGGTANTCSAGTPSGYVNGTCGASKTWTCLGTNGGSNAGCSKTTSVWDAGCACGTQTVYWGGHCIGITNGGNATLYTPHGGGGTEGNSAAGYYGTANVTCSYGSWNVSGTCNACTINAYSACYSGNRWWYDSCGNRLGNIRQGCGSGCSGDTCL